MQVSWIRHAGRYTIQSNYTCQKAMGIVDPANDPYSINANYGALSSDRRNLFNAAYSVDLGTLVHSSHLVNGHSATVGSSREFCAVRERRQPDLRWQ